MSFHMASHSWRVRLMAYTPVHSPLDETPDPPESPLIPLSVENMKGSVLRIRRILVSQVLKSLSNGLHFPAIARSHSFTISFSRQRVMKM